MKRLHYISSSVDSLHVPDLNFFDVTQGQEGGSLRGDPRTSSVWGSVETFPLSVEGRGSDSTVPLVTRVMTSFVNV